MNENENELSDWGLDMDSQDLDNILGLPPVWDEWKMSAYSELPPDGEGYRYPHKKSPRPSLYSIVYMYIVEERKV